MSLSLFSRLLFFSMCLGAVVHANAQPGMRDKIIAWKKSLTVGNTYKQYASVLTFPAGNIGQQLWTSEVLTGLTDKNETVRKRVAYIIGEKKSYPTVSVPALIRLLNDPSDSVASNAIFSLTAFGPRIIRPLFELMQQNPPPYISSQIADVPYSEALKHAKEEKDSTYLAYFYSRSAMRAMLALRFMGDTVMHYLPEYPKIKEYYKTYLLDGISLSQESGLVAQNNDSLHTGSGNNTSAVKHWMVWKNHPDSLPRRIAFYYHLNELCIRKDSFYLIRDSVARLLRRREGDWMLMVLLANMGDSARSLAPELLQYTRPGPGADLQYLAIKAMINFYLRSDSAYVLFPYGLISSVKDDTREDDLVYAHYFSRSDELKEGFELIPEAQAMLQAQQFYNPDYVFGKLYLDKTLNPINKNLRWLDVRDTAAVRIITGFIYHKDIRVRLYAVYALGLCDSMTEPVKQLFIRLASDGESEIRQVASLALMRAGVADKEVNAYTTVFILEEHFQKSINQVLNHLTFDVGLEPLKVFGAGGAPSGVLPAFPDPPPRPSASGLVAFKIPPAANATVENVYEILRENLHQNAYYDLSSFRFADGFALQTKIERISSDGSIDHAYRYTRTKIRPRTIGDYFYQLFCGENGMFRGIAFIVCSKTGLAPFGTELINGATYDLLFAKGSSGWLTSDISARPFAGNNIHVLVYEYGKSAEGIIRFTGQSNAHSITTHFNAINLSSFKLR